VVVGRTEGQITMDIFQAIGIGLLSFPLSAFILRQILPAGDKLNEKEKKEASVTLTILASIVSIGIFFVAL